MNEQAKIILYKQLIKVELISKMKDEAIMEWVDFLKLDDKETLKYTIQYRDKALVTFYNKKHIKEVDRKEFYLELPEMNLEGEDLSNLYLHTFMPGYSKERNNGKKIFITTKINLKDTNCIINFATIHPIIVSEDGINIKEISADIQKCDFRGCIAFGKFQNTKAKLIYTDKNLPMDYIERLEKYKIPEKAELTTDYVYMNMLERKPIKGMKGLDKVKQIVDYDLTSMRKDIWKYRETIRANNIDISYTGAFIEEYGFESIGKENSYIDLETRAKDAYKLGDIQYVEEIFDTLDKETKKNLVTLALRDRKMDFVKEHQKELSDLQKKYLEMQEKEIKEKEEERRIKEILRNEYKEGKLMELRIDLMRTDIGIRSDIIEEIYNAEGIKFVGKYINDIGARVRNEILENEYKNGNEKFVYKNFSKIENIDLKEAILEKECKNKNVEFLCENYENIYNENMKSRILELAFKEEKTKFIKKHFDDLPKNLQIEAIIKFKDLGIPEERMLALLRR